MAPQGAAAFHSAQEFQTQTTPINSLVLRVYWPYLTQHKLKSHESRFKIDVQIASLSYTKKWRTPEMVNTYEKRSQRREVWSRDELASTSPLVWYDTDHTACPQDIQWNQCIRKKAYKVLCNSKQSWDPRYHYINSDEPVCGLRRYECSAISQNSTTSQCNPRM